MRILVLDTETTGLDEGATATEVGAALFSTENNCILWSGACLRACDDKLPAEIPKLTGITDAMLAEESACSGLWAGFVDALAAAFHNARYVLAHNAEFDKRIIGTVPELAFLLETPWICSCVDLQFRVAKSRSLPHLAVDNGIVITDYHRALTDVVTTCKLLQTLPDLEAQILESQKPKALFYALVPYEKRQLAKDAGFTWDAHARRWTRRLDPSTPLDPSPERPFRIARM